MVVTSDFNRSLSMIFSNPVFKEITQYGESPYLMSKLKKYDSLLSVEPGVQVKTIIQTAYRYLSTNYRNEYIYKNILANKILLGRHSVRTANMLNEFKVAGSIADTVIVNGTATVYEIKTEMDSPEKLQKQLADYKKVFTNIFLVTHHSLVSKYVTQIKDESVGLLCLSDKFNLSVMKDSTPDFSGLQIEAMMKSLRKQEYMSIIRDHYGLVPQVSNIQFFSECVKLACKIDIKVMHQKLVDQLRGRALASPEGLESEMVPKELKQICLCIDPSPKEYNNLFNFLSLKL